MYGPMDVKLWICSDDRAQDVKLNILTWNSSLPMALIISVLTWITKFLQTKQPRLPPLVDGVYKTRAF